MWEAAGSRLTIGILGRGLEEGELEVGVEESGGSRVCVVCGSAGARRNVHDLQSTGGRVLWPINLRPLMGNADGTYGSSWKLSYDRWKRALEESRE